MTREQTKELLPIIKAYAEGKTIQYYYIDAGWADIDPDGTIDFSDYPSNYRIKPEPEYHPSKNQLHIKRGDIMMSIDKRAFIANRKIDNDGCLCAYCGINVYHDFTIGTTIHRWTSSPYIPASEEAKKELFDKMAKAGYKWNAKALKLEKIEPKYRPFANNEECWKEMQKHQPFGWIKSNVDKHLYSILAIINNGCVLIDRSIISFQHFYKYNTFADGTPFGIKE